MRFDWDNDKNQINKQKHNVSFEEASTVFYDEEAILIFDPDHSFQEDRFLLLGRSSALRILVVCHCSRDKDDEIIRIISARKANSEERKQYSNKARTRI